MSCAKSPQMKECPHGKSSCCSLRRSGRRLPRRLCPRRHPQDRPLSRRHDRRRRRPDRLQAGSIARQRLGRAGLAQIPGKGRPHPGRDLRQGWSEFGLRQRACRRRDRDLAALLARLHDQGALRQGEEAEARHHRRHRLRSHRPSGRHGQGHHRRRGDLLQLDQRLGAHRHDDPGAGAQLHPLLRLGGERRLEHRRLRRALLRPRRHECRHCRGGPHRPRGAAPAEALRRQAALLRQAPAAEGGGAGARSHLPSECGDRWSRSATWSPSTRRCIPRPRPCSTTS